MSQAGTSRALCLPEVLSAVFEQLTDDCGTLFAAARVSRTWAALALDELWRAPPETAFAGVASPARRAFYAAKVRSLTVWRCDEVLRPLAFPLLRTLGIFHLYLLGSASGTAVSASRSARASDDAQELGGDRCSGTNSGNDKGLYGQFFGPRLEPLSVQLDTEIVQLLLERRPHLRELHILGVEGECHFDAMNDEDVNMDDFDSEDDVLDDNDMDNADEESDDNVDEQEPEEVAVAASNASMYVPNSGILGQIGSEEEAQSVTRHRKR
jgi:hypothetical protein